MRCQAGSSITEPGGGTVFLVLSSSAFCIAHFPLQVVSKWNAAGKKKERENKDAPQRFTLFSEPSLRPSGRGCSEMIR